MYIHTHTYMYTHHIKKMHTSTLRMLTKKVNKFISKNWDPKFLVNILGHVIKGHGLKSPCMGCWHSFPLNDLMIRIPPTLSATLETLETPVPSNQAANINAHQPKFPLRGREEEEKIQLCNS